MVGLYLLSDYPHSTTQWSACLLSELSSYVPMVGLYLLSELSSYALPWSACTCLNYPHMVVLLSELSSYALGLNYPHMHYPMAGHG